MPKRKKRPAIRVSQEPKTQNSARDRRLRIVAIGIIVALITSLVVGAMSLTPSAPASANSVQVVSADQELVDTDGDGIENNQDSDVDGDGIVNGEDPDIDGDGIENFDDADPIDTTDIDSNAPQKPIRPAGAGDTFGVSPAVILIVLGAVVALAISAFFMAKRRGN